MAEKSLEELKNLLGGRLRGDGSVIVKDVASIEDAQPGTVTFLFEQKNLPLLGRTKASAIVADERFSEECGSGNFIFVKDPRLALSRLLSLFRPDEPPASPGVHPLASVHPASRIGAGVSVGAFSVVEEGAEIGQGAVIHPLVFVGRGARVGERSLLYPGVVIREGCVIGNRVIIHANAVIGSDGFGYARDGGRYVKIPQKGIVRVEDDVEIGACVTVDRATLGETRIGRGTKIDNLVQVAHNVSVGADTVIVSQTGIAGSTSIGKSVQLGGQVGVAGHIEVGDGAVVAAQSGVARNVPEGGVYSGSPAIPHGDWLRAQLVFPKLPEMSKKIDALEKRIKKLEEKD